MPTSNSSNKNDKMNHSSNEKSTSNNKKANSGTATSVKTPSAHNKAAGMDEKRRGTSDSNGL